ncbi:MAG: Dps family protein [Bacteroidota bacterium]
MNIGITESNRKAVCGRLQRILADEYVLYTKYRNYHWNIVAPNFSELHALYEEHYDALADVIDEVAERIRTLGHISKGRMADFLDLTHLEEQDYTSDAKEQLANLIADHEAIIRELRRCAVDFDEEYQDLGSSDFVIALMEKHEKLRWLLSSFLS